MEIPEKDLFTYVRLRKILERTRSTKVYHDTEKEINQLLDKYGGKSAEGIFFDHYSRMVEPSLRYK